MKTRKSIRVSDKNKKGGNCRREKPNLYRCLRRCKILKIDLTREKNNSETPVDALAEKINYWLTQLLTT